MTMEEITSSKCPQLKKSVDTISILVVDDDTTCLSIVAAILKKFKYEVVTVKHANDALCTLRIKAGAFDLVVSDVHMPDMNGFELQQAIAQEFNLPVVLMSADHKEGVALKGLENGAAYFIYKPVSPDDVRDLWQFAAMNKRESQVFIIDEESADVVPGENTNLSEINNPIETSAPAPAPASASSVGNEEGANQGVIIREKSPSKEGSDDEKKGESSQSGSQKKSKIIWTNSLHNRFLEAIRSIGLERCVPKKILEVMNVPGLTRENVASHLQKYRIFLRRVSDESDRLLYADKGLRRDMRTSVESSSVTSPSTLMLNRFNKYPYQKPFRFSTNFHVSPSPNLEASSSNLITQSGFGQSRLLSNKGNFLKPNIGAPNLLIDQSDRSCARLAQNNIFQNRPIIQGHIPNISLDDISNAMLPNSDASLTSPTSTNPSTNYDMSSYNNMGTSSTIPSTSSMNNSTKQANYVGYSLTNIKHFVEAGNSDKHEGLSSYNGTINFPSHEEHLNDNSIVHATTMPNDNANVDHEYPQLDHEYPQLDHQHVAAPNNNSFVIDNITNGGEQLSDVIASYQALLPSNLPLHYGVENGEGNIHESAVIPMFDMSEIDGFQAQQPLDVRDFGDTFVDQVNIIDPNQAQQTGGETIDTSNFYSVNQWINNCVPSFDDQPRIQCSQGLVNSQELGNSSQLNETSSLLPPNELQQVYQGTTHSLGFGTSSQLINGTTFISSTERDDEDFLESLLAPYVDDQPYQGN